MKKLKLKRAFNLKDLNEQVNNPNACIYVQKTRDHLALHPYHLNDLNSSVKEILNRKIGKFFSWLDGILCGYKNIKFLSEKGYISDDSCFVHLDIEADFFVFRPTPEKILHGVINKKTSDHLGCLVHKIFNVSLPRPKQTQNWIGDSITLNTRVELQINKMNFDGKLPYLKGTLVSNVEDSVTEIGGTQDELKKKNKKKKDGSKQAKRTVCQESDEHINIETLYKEDTDKSPKKKKKRKLEDLDI